ncbi:MAG TPA: oxidoreductase [Actinophytocola sp.]|uniref:oxidoreductase n=1 Tax=Actinophytocola sp. TaxID=1872138 RepID=UPI002DDCD34D|nr:oxidoreductase [Actinophytocola sp.]HEV2782365.1 oxidoreductase [Actinophytocola sp.]
MPTITGTVEVRTTLEDPDVAVPTVPPARRGIAWLRAGVARFSTGDAHHRRRATAIALLATVDTAELRERARGTAAPVEVLAGALGLAGSAGGVATVARSYHPHLEITAEADDAVARLVEACGGTWDEATAARIGLLVQACDATAALVRNALRRGETGDAGAIVARTLADDPPVRITRRVRAGEPIELDLTGLPFGAGPHACPGREHAIAIARGMLEAGR